MAIPPPPKGRVRGAFEIEVEMEDLYEIEEGMAELWRKWPRLLFATFAEALRGSIKQAMKEAAPTGNPTSTGDMEKSVEVEFVIDDRDHARLLGSYNVPYLQHYVEGTGVSLGRFVMGLIPEDTSHWNQLGARLSLTKMLQRGAHPRSIGMHPGQPPHPELYLDIEERLSGYMDRDIERFEEMFSGSFDALITGLGK